MEQTFSDRERTNFLRSLEQQWILALCRIMPEWVTPNLLTAVGLLGSFLVFLGLYLGQFARIWLFLCLVGLAVNWFGDSLDGRLAYYRNRPRKWYGFSLDILADWASMFLIVVGFYFYLDQYRLLPFVYLLTYGALMLIALLRYKITGDYSIDAFGLGPTEMRIIVAVFILIEMFREHTLLQVGTAGAVIITFLAIMGMVRLLRAADEKDKQERERRAAEEAQ